MIPEIPNPTLIGPIFVVVITLLSGYFLALRIQEHFKETPDPKLTYAHKREISILRDEIRRLERDGTAWFEALRQESKADQQLLEERFHGALTRSQEIVTTNAEQIAALIAQVQIGHQRLSELTIKTDKLLERSRPS
tara:strand:+ start:61 stop:471 length:411 start_codon:yes stop_codon:yes gene_type:complete